MLTFLGIEYSWPGVLTSIAIGVILLILAEKIVQSQKEKDSKENA